MFTKPLEIPRESTARLFRTKELHFQIFTFVQCYSAFKTPLISTPKMLLVHLANLIQMVVSSWFPRMHTKDIETKARIAPCANREPRSDLILNNSDCAT